MHYEIVSDYQTSEDFLKGFIRDTRTTEMLVVKDHRLEKRIVDFVDQWDEEKLRDISRYLRRCIVDGGKVVAAFDGQQTVGFANVEPKIYDDTYIQMPFIHVTKTHRGKGIGHRLFQMIEEIAAGMGAKKLYISTHPDVRVQAFYDAVGTVIAQKTIKEIYDQEPYDIQREKAL